MVLITICWGAAYLFTDIALTDVPPLILIAFRFLLGGSVAFILKYKRLKNVDFRTLKFSILLGLAYTVAYVGYTLGIKYTSLTNAGFLCPISMVFAPLLALIFKHEIPERKTVLVVLMCLIGIGCMTLTNEFTVAFGDAICLLSPIGVASGLLLTEEGLKRGMDAFHIGVFPLLFTGLITLLLAVIFEEPNLPQTSAVWGATLFLGCVATGLCFVLRTIMQKFTTPNHISVIYSLESVWTALIAFFIAGERLNSRSYIGAAILFISVIIMEFNFKALPIAKKNG